MFLQVDFSKEPFRLLYNTLYTEVKNFALECGDPEDYVKAKFASLVTGDSRVKLYIELNDKAEVTAFCLATVQEPFVQVDYWKAVSGHNEQFMKESIVALESLPNITRLILACNENKYKAYRKKYGFTAFKMIMHRDVKRE